MHTDSAAKLLLYFTNSKVVGFVDSQKYDKIKKNYS